MGMAVSNSFAGNSFKDKNLYRVSKCINNSMANGNLINVVIKVLEECLEELNPSHYSIVERLGCKLEVLVKDKTTFGSSEMLLRRSCLFIPILALPKSLQNKGFCTKLINKLIKEFLTLNSGCILVQTVTNKDLRRMLLRLGFIPIYYTDNSLYNVEMSDLVYFK